MTQDSGLRTQDELCSVKFEEFERECLDEIYDKLGQYSRMAKNERYFLNGIIRYLKPAKILEVGVFNGGGSAIILNAIKDFPHSQLISVDYCEKLIGGNSDRLSGWFIDERFPHLKGKWTLHRGGDISRYIEQIGGDIDLLVLDTAHIHPWETLNFLCILPFMKIGSWCVLHDIALSCIPSRENELACRYLWGHVVSDCKANPAPDHIPHFSNIGAFRITDDTRKYVRNLFESLLCPWAAIPGIFDKKVFPLSTPILPSDIDDIKKVITKYYPDYAAFLDHAIELQEGIAKYKAERYNSWRETWKRNSLWSYKILRALKHLLTGK